MEILNMISSFFSIQIVKNHIFTSDFLLQISTATMAFILAYATSVIFRKMLNNRVFFANTSKQVITIAHSIALPFIWSIIQWTLVASCQEFNWPYGTNETIAKFITAWLITCCTSHMHFASKIRKCIALVVYLTAFLDVLGLISPLITVLDKAALNIGDLHISFLSVMKGGLIFYILLWGTVRTSRWVELALRKSGTIDPSLQELFSKLIRITFVTFSVLISLSSSGLDLSAFTVFGGAIGVGIGFGLQKVVSNLICGIILLLDRSIKPGDVIALEQGKSYGEINKLGARCVSVRTRSGKEHLIPNEDFITHKSENWSFSDSLIRLSLPMRAGLDSDVNLVMTLLVDATKNVERVVNPSKTGARLRGFSDSAIEFELRVWINDPKNGVSKVKSDIYLKIWTLFNQHGISIPHAQRDLHIQSTVINDPSALKDTLENHSIFKSTPK